MGENFIFLCLTYNVSCAKVQTNKGIHMRNMRNNFGVKGVSTPDASFFSSLKRPVNAAMVKRTKNIFKGIENVKVCCVDAQ